MGEGKRQGRLQPADQHSLVRCQPSAWPAPVLRCPPPTHAPGPGTSEPWSARRLPLPKPTEAPLDLVDSTCLPMEVPGLAVMGPGLRAGVSGRGGECVGGGVDERVLAAGLLALRRGRGGGRSHVSPVSASPLTTTTLDTPILGCWCTTSQNDCFCRRVWGGKDCWGSQVAHPPAGAGRALFVLLADEALRWAAAGGRQGARRRRRW